MTTDAAETREKRLDAWLALTGQIPAPTEPVELPLLTGSMSPAIPIDAVLRIAVIPDRVCRIGEVAIFMADDKLIAHRVLLVLQLGSWHWLLEKGDTNQLGHWRRSSTVRGRVLGFSVAGLPAQGDPIDKRLARIGLRRHIIRWLLTFGGQRDTKPNE